MRFDKRGGIAALLLVMGLVLSGCAPIQPGQDAVAVNAERSYALAFDTVDAFLKLEDANRDLCRAKLPAVHAFAEQTRKTAPPVVSACRDAIRAYESASTPDNKSKLDAALAALESVSASAQSYAAQIHANGAH